LNNIFLFQHTIKNILRSYLKAITGTHLETLIQLVCLCFSLNSKFFFYTAFHNVCPYDIFQIDNNLSDEPIVERIRYVKT
jgi:hypothetical protein